MSIPAALMNASITLKMATTLKDAGVAVVNASLWKGTLRVDVAGKAAATKALDMLKAAGLSNARTLKGDSKGAWMVVGVYAA